MKTLRIWFGCSLGLALSMLFGWSYGFFAVSLPLFMLSKMERYSYTAHIRLLGSILFTTIVCTLFVQIFQSHPALLIAAIGIMMLINCVAMMTAKNSVFGYVGLLVGSIILNFASYDFFDIEDFNVNLWVIAASVACIDAIAFWLFPDKGTSPNQKKEEKPYTDETNVITQVVLGWTVAMLAFVVFQSMDLFDSLSALASVIIILAPMTVNGAKAIAKARVLGTGLGCIAGASVQLILGKWFGNGVLFWLAFTIAMGWFCHWQTKGPVKGAIGFSAMSALAVPLTTTLVPEKQDAVFSILYRFSSIFVAVTVTLMVMSLVNFFANKPKPVLL